MLLTLLWLLSSATTEDPETVAIFYQPGFPVFASSRELSPRRLAQELRQAGVRVELLDAQALADRRGLTPQRHVALVSLSGNTFPRTAAPNIERFHRAGGCVLAVGVPFCHECVRAGPVRWSPVAASDDRVLVVEDEPRDGPACLEITHGPTSPWSGVTSVRLPARAGDRFVVSGWVKTAGDVGQEDADRLYVRFFDDAEAFLGQQGPRLPEAGEDWSFIESEVVAPAAAAADVCLAVFSQGRCLADGISLRRADQTQELIANGGFDQLSDAWLDLGHTDAFLGHDATGVGGFLIKPCGGRLGYEPTDDDPMDIAWLDWPEFTPGPQAVIDPASFPGEDEVIGVAGPLDANGVLQGYSVAVIRHHCRQFVGATDVWLGYPGLRPPQGYQVAMSAVALVLRERGLLDARGAKRVREAALRLEAPPPRSYRLAEHELPHDRILPKSPPPGRRLLVTRLHHASPDMQLTLRALQGLANRREPTVYVADRWVRLLGEEGYEVEQLADPLELLDRFRHAYDGAILYDPCETWTANMALVLGALEDCLPATAEVAEELGLTVKRDMRRRFRDSVEAYAWARKHLLPRCNRHVVCHIKQAEPLGIGGAVMSASLADYLVAHRIFCFHLDREFGPEERLEAERILACFPAHTPVIGYFGPEPSAAPNLANEWEIVEITSALAKQFVFLVNDNLSVHSGLPSPVLEQRSRPLPEMRDDRVYVSFYLSDGDSPSTWYRVWNHWEDPARGALPLGWSLGPATVDVCPLPLRELYDQATERDCFVNSCSGAGYIYPERYGTQVKGGEDLLLGFMDHSAAAMGRCDFTVLNTHHHPSIRDRTLGRMADAIPGLEGLIAGYGKCAESYADSHRLSPGGVPVFRCLTTGATLGTPKDKIVETMHRELLEAAPEERPAFIQAFAIYWFVGPSDVKAVVDRLGPEFEVVRPDELAALYRQWRARSAERTGPGMGTG